FNDAACVVDLDTGKVILAIGKGPRMDPNPRFVAAPEETFLGLRFGPDGRHLLTFSSLRAVIWHAQTGSQLRASNLHGTGYAVSADGNRIAALSPAGSGEKMAIALFDGFGKRLVRFPVDSEFDATISTLSDDGKVLATLLRRQEVRV